MSQDITEKAIKLLNPAQQALFSSILWQGAKPCSQCGGTIHSRYEPKANAWVCAGCYNELAVTKGWEIHHA